jgi:hypothetical protein
VRTKNWIYGERLKYSTRGGRSEDGEAESDTAKKLSIRAPKNHRMEAVLGGPIFLPPAFEVE